MEKTSTFSQDSGSAMPVSMKLKKAQEVLAMAEKHKKLTLVELAKKEIQRLKDQDQI